MIGRFAETLPYMVGDGWSVDELYVFAYPKGSKRNCKHWPFVILDNDTGTGAVLQDRAEKTWV